MRHPLTSALALTLLACATTPKGPVAGPDPAVIASQDLNVPEQGLTQFEVKWEGTLQSPEAATLERATWELVADGKVVKSGEQRFDLPLPAGEAVPVSLEQEGRYVDSAEELKALGERPGSMLVALRGKLFVNRADTTDELEYARSRELRMPRLPMPGLREVEGARYSAESANLIFHLTITNPNPFPVSIDGFTYTAVVAGKQMAEGTVAQSNTVRASESDAFEFQVNLNQETYGPEVKKLIKDRSIPWKVTGTLKGELLERTLNEEGVVRLPSGQ